MTHNNLLNSYISTFLLIPLLYLLKGLFSIQGTESIFWETHSKNLPPSSLHSEIRQVWVYGQAEHTKNKDVGSTTWTSNCTCRTALIHRLRISLIPYKVTLNSWGLAPKPLASTYTQKQGAFTSVWSIFNDFCYMSFSS